MTPYLDLLRLVLEIGDERGDRTGTGTISVFGTQSRYDLRDGFPLVTTKKVVFASVVRELLWFLSGSTNINDNLTQHTKIWDAWSSPDGDIGPAYGRQWMKWGATPSHSGIDQISQVIKMVKTDPSSRRLIVSAWNVSEIHLMNLPCCHVLFQFYVQGEFLDCQLYQRSADLALGVPFNIASYALLMSMVAQECGLTPRYFIHSIGDAHIYLNHVEGIKAQLDRAPFPLPQLKLANKPVLDMKFEDIELVDYQHHPFIKFEVAV